MGRPYAVRVALTEIVQALAAGQLEARTAGKMLYAIQRVSATNRRIEQMEAAQLEKRKDAQDQMPQVRASLLGANLGSQADDTPAFRSVPSLRKKFGLPPGADLDVVTDAVLQKADEEAELRQSESLSLPPPVWASALAYRVFREEAYQALRLQLRETQHQFRDYNEQKRQQVEKMKKEMLSATPGKKPILSSESVGRASTKNPG